MSDDKRLTSDQFLERLKTIVNLPDDIINLDISLHVNLMAVISLTRYATANDDIDKTELDLDHNRTIDEMLAVYNVSDLNDVINENKALREVLSRIVKLTDEGILDVSAIDEAHKLLVEK